MLSFEFETRVDEHGFHITSPDMDNMSAFFEKPPETQNILDMMLRVVQIDLFMYGLGIKKHMLVLEDAQANLQAGGRFKCLVVPQPD